jgi:hypothetical protein
MRWARHVTIQKEQHSPLFSVYGYWIKLKDARQMSTQFPDMPPCQNKSTNVPFCFIKLNKIKKSQTTTLNLAYIQQNLIN